MLPRRRAASRGVALLEGGARRPSSPAGPCPSVQLREELEACTQTQVVPYDGLDLVAPPAAFRTRAHEAATVVHDMREGRTFGSSPLLR